MKYLGAVLCTLCTYLLVSSVSASPAAETRYLDERARSLFYQRNYRAALESFLSVYEVTPSASAAYNVALSSERTGEPALAFSLLREYFRLAEPEHPTYRDAKKLMGHLTRSLALVEVKSDPPGATIYVDREDLGSYGTTPSTIVVEPSRHEIILKAPHFIPFRAEISAQQGKTAKASSVLSPALTTLVLSANVPDAVFVVTVRHQRFELKAGVHRVPSGSCTIVAHAPGYLPQETLVTAPPLDPTDEEIEVTLRLTAVPQRKGRLLIDTAGPIARVAIDGRLRGETPLALDVPIGTHELRVTAPGYVDRILSIRIASAQAVYRHVLMTPSPRTTSAQR